MTQKPQTLFRMLNFAKATKTIAACLLIGMVNPTVSRCEPSPFDAMEIENLNIALKVQIPGESEEVLKGKGDDAESIGSRISKPKVVKINNKQILKLLGIKNGKLVLNGGDIGIQTGKGENSTIESIGSLEFDPGAVVVSYGQDTDVTAESKNGDSTVNKSKSKYKSSSAGTDKVVSEAVTIDSFAGLATENASKSSTEKSTEKGYSSKGGQTRKFSITGAGDGSILVGDELVSALFSGKISTAGKITVNYQE